MAGFSKTVYMILSSPVTLYLSSVLVNLFCFQLLLKLVRTVNISSPWIPLLFSCLNAAIAFGAEVLTLSSVNPLDLCIIPALLVAELALISRDGWWAYLNFFFALLLDTVCIHGLSSAFITLCLGSPWPLGSPAHRFALFSISMLGSSLIIWFISHSRYFSVGDLSDLMHSKTRGLLLFIYFLVSSVVMLLSTLTTLTLEYDSTIPHYVQIRLHWDLVLKDGLILMCSFLIIMVQAWQERSFHRSRALSLDLQKERSFRASSQRGSLISYCANVTKNQVVEGQEFFSPQLSDESDGYVEMIKQFALKCVHPEDWSKLFSIGNSSYFQEKLEQDPTYDLRLRLSPVRMLAVTKLPEEMRDKLTALGKEWIWVKFSVTVTRDAASGDILSYLSLTDIDDEVIQEDALRQAASTDSLTGLFNRSALYERIQQYLLGQNAAGALFIIDQDYFKSINDQLGHPVGDQALKDTSDLLRAVFRGQDIIGRLGGDEFCVFAPGMTNQEIICQRASQVNQQGQRAYSSAGAQVSTSLSIGIAIFPRDGSDSDTLYLRADTALYQAKAGGRNTFRIYSPDMEPAEE